MALYYSEKDYIQDSKTLKDKIAKIDKVIDALIDEAVVMAQNEADTMSQYSLDDGQTSISASYRTVDEVRKAIRGFRQLRNELTADLVGRHYRITPSEGFR